MFSIYLGITAAVLGMSAWCFVTEKDWRNQIMIAMVILPLLLRVFLVK